MSGSHVNEVVPARLRRTRFEPADAVIAGSSLLVAAIVAVFVLLCIQGYSTTIQQTREKSERAAMIVADGSKWIVASTLSVLETSVARFASGGAGEVQRAFEVGAASLPTDFAFGVYDVAGMLLTGTGAAPASIAERDYFSEADATGWMLGAQESIEQGSGSFAVSKPMVVAGELHGFAVAYVGDRLLEQLAAPQNLGEASTVSIVRSDGWIVARHPRLAERSSLIGTGALDQLQSATSGSYISSASPVDGVSRIVGFHHVPELGFVAVASVSTETALGGLWYSIWIVSLLLAPIGLALLVGSFATARLLRRTQAARVSLAAALERNEDLFREIHHRVKNNLQSINSLLRLHPIPREVREDMSKRIFAMSAVHEHIYRSKAFDDVRVKDYLHTLVESIRGGSDPRTTVLEDLDDVIVGKDAAAPLGLILNEVLTNCFKHAFRDKEPGTIWVALKARQDGSVVLEVRDNGTGFDPAVPSRGIGRKLIEGFASQLQGTATHRQDGGYVFTMEFPGRLAEPTSQGPIDTHGPDAGRSRSP